MYVLFWFDVCRFLLLAFLFRRFFCLFCCVLYVFVEFCYMCVVFVGLFLFCIVCGPRAYIVVIFCLTNFHVNVTEICFTDVFFICVYVFFFLFFVCEFVCLMCVFVFACFC